MGLTRSILGKVILGRAHFVLDQESFGLHRILLQVGVDGLARTVHAIGLPSQVINFRFHDVDGILLVSNELRQLGDIGSHKGLIEFGKVVH